MCNSLLLQSIYKTPTKFFLQFKTLNAKDTGRYGGAAAWYRITRAKHNEHSIRFWGGGWQRTIKKTPWKCDQGGMMKKCIWPQCALCLEFMTLSSMGKPVINLKSKRVCTAGMTTGIPTYKELPLSKHLKIKN